MTKTKTKTKTNGALDEDELCVCKTELPDDSIICNTCYTGFCDDDCYRGHSCLDCLKERE